MLRWPWDVDQLGLLGGKIAQQFNPSSDLALGSYQNFGEMFKMDRVHMHQGLRRLLATILQMIEIRNIQNIDIFTVIAHIPEI